MQKEAKQEAHKAQQLQRSLGNIREERAQHLSTLLELTLGILPTLAEHNTPQQVDRLQYHIHNLKNIIIHA